jgi:hypothetical protein
MTNEKTKMGENTDDLDDDDLDKMIDAILAPPSRRKRGRPKNGLEKAQAYSDQYWELIRSGMSRWRAVEEVAARNFKTPQHIAACRKLIEDTDPYELGILEDDRVDYFLKQENN